MIIIRFHSAPCQTATVLTQPGQHYLLSISTNPDVASGAAIIAQLIGFTGIFSIEHRTREYGRVRKNSLWNQEASEGVSSLVQYSG